MMTLFFGSPGCGKTTYACYLLKRHRKPYKYTFANFGCSCSDYDNVSLESLGKWTFPEKSHVVIDEAGIQYNNRAFKSFPKEAIQWFKLHRHYDVDVTLLSQSWEDTDITLRRLCDRLYYLKKVGCFTLCRRVYKRVTVDKQTEQIIDGYKLISPFWLLLKPVGFLLPFLPIDDVTLIYRPRYYKYFDTRERPYLSLPAWLE